MLHLFVAGLDPASNPVAVGEVDVSPRGGTSVDARVTLEASGLGSVTSVTINGATHTVDGSNIPRGPEQLILYTNIPGQTVTPTNVWGAETLVERGTVTSITDRQTTQGPGIDIPMDGYVLSGHDTAREWLLANAQPGVTVTLN
jgi:hypothetical protein